MKKFFLFLVNMVCIVSLMGCADKEETGVFQEIISSELLGQGIYEALQEEWDAWDALSEEQKRFSSHMPGYCYIGFDDWTECEEFLGFHVFNPLENNSWLEKGSYVGMPTGYRETPRFNVSFYGTSEGQIQWIHVDSGYRSGEIRITVNAQVFIDSLPEESENEEPLITKDSGERYTASTAVLTRGPITYSIRVIGEPGMQETVTEMLEEVLSEFTSSAS